VTTANEGTTPEPQRSIDVSRLLPVVVGLGIVALLVSAMLTSRHVRLQPGDVAPDLALTLFDGSETSLASLRGNVVVVNFWASWCVPCRQEAPSLQWAWENYRDRGAVILGITYKDSRKASLAFVEEFGLTYLNGPDLRGRISDTYGVTAVPETYIVDREGRIAWTQIGEVTVEDLARELDRLLTE
jgi:cytochrome c biogenesis protein CcmG/thiol:disulfide interchange protein DsbE